MTPKIPIRVAECIAKEYGFDQVIIVARKTGDGPTKGEALTTYGINKQHCNIAAKVGEFLRVKIMKWSEE